MLHNAEYKKLKFTEKAFVFHQRLLGHSTRAPGGMNGYPD